MTNRTKVVDGKRVGPDPHPNYNPPHSRNQEKSPPRAISGRERDRDPRGGRAITRCLRAIRDGAALIRFTYAVYRDQREGRAF